MAPRFRREATAFVRTEDPEVHLSVGLVVRSQRNLDEQGKTTVPKYSGNVHFRSSQLHRRSARAQRERRNSLDNLFDAKKFRFDDVVGGLIRGLPRPQQAT